MSRILNTAFNLVFRTCAVVIIALASTQFVRAESLPLITRDDVKLDGVLAASKLSDMKAIALLLPGSGDTSETGEVSGPFIGYPYKNGRGDLNVQIAEQFTKNGIISYRYAKRGNKDKSLIAQQTMPYLIDDAVDAVEMLKKKYPRLPVVLVGMSEGALVALNVAQRTPVDKLLLLSVPTRPMADVLSYQFLEWPLEKILNKYDTDRDLMLEKDELLNAVDEGLPLLPREITALLAKSVPVEPELRALYSNEYKKIGDFIASNDALKEWLQSFEKLPNFETLAKKTNVPTYVFQGLLDPQIRASWVLADVRHLAKLERLHVYANLGHCFAPLDGTFEQVKTSGPIESDVLDDIVQAVLQ